MSTTVQGDKMPCKGMLPNCVTDIGCIFLVSLPAPDLTLVTMTAWSSVIYDNASEGVARAHDQARFRPSHLPRLNRSEPIFYRRSPFLARRFRV